MGETSADGDGFRTENEKDRARQGSPSKASADKAAIFSQDYPRSGVDADRIALDIQVAKKHAVSQALSEGCLGNFKSFDSPFGNYLVPVIPTRADLLGSHEAEQNIA